MLTHRLDRCPACGSVDGDDERLGEHPLQRCRRCDVVYALDYADPDAVFTPGYLTADSDFGLNVLDPGFQRFLAEVGDARMRSIATVTRPPGRFLDVGCGTGEVLAAAGRAGWDAVGVELVETSVEHCRANGLDVRHGRLEETDLPTSSFDVVAAFHVLEHLTDEPEFLRLLIRYVRPGGHVVVEVPNWDSSFRTGHGERWPHLRPLEHLAHHTPETLAATLRRAGLDPALVTTPNYLPSSGDLRELLSALGRGAWHPVLRRLATVEHRDGARVQVAGRTARLLIAATDRLDQRRRRGQVVFAVSRVR